MDTKICNICRVEKDINYFQLGINKRNGIEISYRYNKCKDCDKDRINKKNAKSRAKRRVQNRKYQIEYNKRPGRKEAQAEYDRQYYTLNKDKIVKRATDHTRKKRATDPIFRMKEIISNSIGQALKKRGSKKNGNSTFKFLPYSLEELRQHLEAQFEPWMTWDNHGVYRLDIWDDNNSSTWTWQVDHIIPHSMFNYTSMKDESFQKCWALENLRPYSAKQNIIDKDRK